MSRLADRVVLITGASSGIGAACARAFAAEGAVLVLAARRRERLEALAAELRAAHRTQIELVTLDVREEAAVTSALAALRPPFHAVDVLINNAGLSRGMSKLHEGASDDWHEMIDTNIKGLLTVTRAIVPGMVERGRGHVINLGSLAGHEVYPGGAVYCATKHAVRALSRGLRMDLLGTPIRVSSVDPGMVETEFSVVRFHGDEARAQKIYEGLDPLVAEDITDAILYCATRPVHVNIDDIVMMPVAQASTTLNHRRSKAT
ncbi:MAG: SDR family NAD(P)-dependent oxidoreductase [Myxococcota bacterium]